jgi:2'-5' RNA ligase
MDNLRLFIGLWPEPPLREALQQHQAAWSWPRGARLVAPEKLHMTLHFLGDVEAARVPPLQAALASVAVPQMVLPWGPPALWGGGLAVLLTQAHEALDALHATLADLLQAQGLPVERRRFKPHVTLARRADGAVPAPLPPALPYAAQDIVLVASVAGRYTLLSRHGAQSFSAPA